MTEEVKTRDYSKQIEGLKRYNEWKTTQPRGTNKDVLKENWLKFKVENNMPITKPKKNKKVINVENINPELVEVN
jgi:hypothetical protein